MKILITGANGFLASRLCKALKNHEISAFTREQMDFTNDEEVVSRMEETKPDIVIHCGAISDVGACERNPELSYRVNVGGTENIAKACGSYGVKLIFCSSDQVYLGHPGQAPHLEEEQLSPPHTYGIHKLQAEQKCLEHNKDSVCLRLSWMYDKEIRIGAEHGNLITNIREALEKKEEIRYPVYDFRSITNVWEVVTNVEKVFELSPGIYNFGSENGLSTYEVVKHLLTLMGAADAGVEENKEAFSDNPRNLRMDISKIRRCGIDFLTTIHGLEKAL
ncbi:SDR family oxidoreductase [Kineothrix sp. MB12-C1]|uniref:SDR family oxidoreductase n=1 Tax=Kineothrix sp. MB12-C1 TaxID=3070215 RepID=UPI0027D211DE|nr:sugar nucleotide-binding protein [Kineothrix sp. MB12-C1]WMC93368.1 sugar nucleotide-binding protein [Kineothrix sp. MB12-C1]